MKYLTDYIKEEQTVLFKKMGVFFAFSREQFEENKNPEVKKYINLGLGTLCPKENVKQFIKEHDKIIKKGRKADLEENGRKGVIERELLNYECFYVNDITDAVEALEVYDIKEKEILEVYKNFDTSDLW